MLETDRQPRKWKKQVLEWIFKYIIANILSRSPLLISGIAIVLNIINIILFPLHFWATTLLQVSSIFLVFILGYLSASWSFSRKRRLAMVLPIFVLAVFPILSVPLSLTTGAVLELMFVVALILIAIVWLLPLPKIEITSPREDADVRHTEIVKGTAYHVPHDKYLWIVIHNVDGNRYYPQEGRPETVASTYRWRSRTLFGKKTGDLNVNEKFDIIPALADKNAHDFFTKYIEESKREEHKAGLGKEDIPDGVTLYDSVTVIRKKSL